MRIRRWDIVLEFLNESQVRVTRLTGTDESLAKMREIAQEWPDLIMLDPDGTLTMKGYEDFRLMLRECVENILDTKEQWRLAKSRIKNKRRLQEWEWEASRRLYESMAKLWNDALHGVKVTLTPRSSHANVFEDADFREGFWRHSELSDYPDFKFTDVFKEGGPHIRGDDPTINYGIQFLRMLSDPEAGINRLFKCLYCEKIQLGRPDQKFCATDDRGNRNSKCRSSYNNALRSQEQKREAVQKSRATLLPVHSPIAKKKKRSTRKTKKGPKR